MVVVPPLRPPPPRGSPSEPLNLEPEDGIGVESGLLSGVTRAMYPQGPGFDPQHL